MPRKLLKSKLKAQLRTAKLERDVEYQKAGVTINYELAVMQSVCMAHGVMATMKLSCEVLGEDSAEYKAIEAQSQLRIGQCLSALVGMGLTVPEANRRIIQGH